MEIFDLKNCTYVEQGKWNVVQFDLNGLSLYVRLKITNCNTFVQYYSYNLTSHVFIVPLDLGL